MKQKTRMIHPNFIIGLISYFGLLAGVILYSNDFEIAKIFIAGSLILGIIHWIISVVSVIRDQLKNKNESWIFWFTAVFIVPPIGGMMYYMVNDKRVAV